MWFGIELSWGTHFNFYQCACQSVFTSGTIVPKHDGSYLLSHLLVSFYFGDNISYPSVSGSEMFWCVLRDFIRHVDTFWMSFLTCVMTGFVFTCPQRKSGAMELWWPGRSHNPTADWDRLQVQRCRKQLASRISHWTKGKRRHAGGECREPSDPQCASSGSTRESAQWAQWSACNPEQKWESAESRVVSVPAAAETEARRSSRRADPTRCLRPRVRVAAVSANATSLRPGSLVGKLATQEKLWVPKLNIVVALEGLECSWVHCREHTTCRTSP